MLLVKSLLFCSLIFLVSCGVLNKSDSNDGSSTPQKSTAPAFSLIGVNGTSWSRSCDAYEEDRFSRRYSIYLEDFSYRLVEDLFDGPICAENLKRITYTEFHDNVRKNSSVKLSGWTTFASQIEKTTAVIHQEVLVTLFNNKSKYGFTDWKAQEAKDVSGRKVDEKAEPEYEAGTGYERTFKIDSNNLHIAKYVNGVPQERTDRPYKKNP